VDIVAQSIVCSREDGASAARQLLSRGAEVALVLQTMAVPPAFILTALGDSDLPVVIWAASRSARVAQSFDHADITSEGAIVGSPMLTSTLTRAGHPFEVLLGPLGEKSVRDAVLRATRVAAAAYRLSHARIGRVGVPVDGYDCVDADGDRLLAATGITLVPIKPAEVEELYVAVADERVMELERETRELYEVATEVEGRDFLPSLRAACALQELVARHSLDAGAMNCHVPEIRFGGEVGMAPCFGLGLLTSSGVPWGCVGDVLTTVAMLAVKLLGGSGPHLEIEALDHPSGEFVLASAGEFDLAFGCPARPQLIKNRWFESDSRCGPCPCFSPPAGPATLAGFVQLDHPTQAYRFVAARGEFTGHSWPAVGTINAGFRFAGGSGTAQWIRWCRAGVHHHLTGTPGDLAADIETVARFLGVEAIVI
jgi:L-arabinose isomerase